ncbi:MAG: decaprenyl-phosphate phosphoribosyltransferase [Planctomycetes bacterium]|nr:decaprenyl-phosphate phosphoribosyltransferase [Planctomycetota bacterium]MCB9920280.1 decaprenyl-phosphate phosphoribosyltransferase [Planctomycetota bacterium]
MKALLEAIRPVQWVKNLLVFAPLVFSKHLFDATAATHAVIAFSAFCLVASSIYLFNDLFDVERDREHPQKRNRPLASGRLSIGVARAAFVILAMSGIAIGVLAPLQFYVPITVYFALNIAYSVRLKHVAIIDTMCIAIGFVLRVLTGGLAIGQPVSGWLILCTFFIALMLAFCKRRHEISLLGVDSSSHRRALDDYSLHFLDQLIAPLGALTVTTYALYTVAPQTIEKFGTENLIWTVPFVVYGVFRYLWLVHMRSEGGNPTKLLLSDVPTLLNVFAWGAVALWAVYGGAHAG